MTEKEVVEMSEEEYHEMCDEYGGICLSCHHHQYGVEPDAREYVCEECGDKQVYGVEELLIMGQLVFT